MTVASETLEEVVDFYGRGGLDGGRCARPALVV